MELARNILIAAWAGVFIFFGLVAFAGSRWDYLTERETSAAAVGVVVVFAYATWLWS